MTAVDPFANFSTTGLYFDDVSASLFLLLRVQQLKPEVFICPSSTLAKTWDFGGGSKTAMNWTNRGGQTNVQKHLSYSDQRSSAAESAVSLG